MKLLAIFSMVVAAYVLCRADDTPGSAVWPNHPRRTNSLLPNDFIEHTNELMEKICKNDGDLKEWKEKICASKHLMRPVIGFEKRDAPGAGEGAHCGCRTKYRPYELEAKYYPRYISVAHCEPIPCPVGVRFCRRTLYNIKVLRRRDIAKHEPVDVFVPETLREDWIFDEIPVAVACECDY